MATRKHALLLFARPPIPGIVKTRLTKEKGGPFSREEAAEIFRRSMFDVAELCCLALHELEMENILERSTDSTADELTYSFFISTTPAENVDAMRQTFEEIGQWPREFTYIVDEGTNYDEHLDSAFRQIFDEGFDSVLSVGADIPLLPREHVVNGMRWLQYFLSTSEKGGIVQAPCQEVGISVIGWTRDTEIDHQGVYDDVNGRPALDAYVEKAQANEIPMASMMPVAGIDDVSDFAHATSLARAAQYSRQFQPDLYVPERFLAWVDWRGIRVGTPPSEEQTS
ncbi:MAG: DUF2064 domain-containing protein [Coriobacteriales bacterium]|jgi:glycosyltransferase A (GT-A) superfamily protein (DUF2064 family)|nr:DUF2064 domain-containing protein [Coriobacteriales bacterium]